MTIIEQAAKRLEALRQAGVDVPWSATGRIDGAPQKLGTEQRPISEPGFPATRAATDRAANGVASGTISSKPARPSSPARPVQIDLDRLAKSGQLTPELSSDLGQLAAEYRIIKRPLMKGVEAAVGDPSRRANLIMVTSAVPGEGKTFSALNLAMSIAMEVDRTVLLVDADVIRPSVLERCGLPPSKGLLDVLTDPSMPLGDALLRTNVPKLTLLPAGTAQANATELLASGAMESLLEELANRYRDRIVIFDAPPLLPSPESRVLAGRVGQVVVVIEQGRSTKDSVRQAFATLQGCPNVTSILNKCRDRSQSSLYGPYYYGGGRPS